ncbi:MAG: hypothetical protein ACK5JT_06020 [Hyphomicrobiaceae bacterium]
MRRPSRLLRTSLFLLVLSTLRFVYASDPLFAQDTTMPHSPTGSAQTQAQDRANAGLPRPVVAMYDAIMEAVNSGKIEDLRIAVEMNEIQPLIGERMGGDAMDTFRKLGKKLGDQHFLTIIGNILKSRWIALPLGADHENNRIYVWPRFAETGLARLSKSDLQDFEAIVPAEKRKPMLASGRYDGFRVGIGADGTWHFFAR